MSNATTTANALSEQEYADELRRQILERTAALPIESLRVFVAKLRSLDTPSVQEQSKSTLEPSPTKVPV